MNIKNKIKIEDAVSLRDEDWAFLQTNNIISTTNRDENIVDLLLSIIPHEIDVDDRRYHFTLRKIGTSAYHSEYWRWRDVKHRDFEPYSYQWFYGKSPVIALFQMVKWLYENNKV